MACFCIFFKNESKCKSMPHLFIWKQNSIKEQKPWVQGTFMSRWRYAYVLNRVISRAERKTKCLRDFIRFEHLNLHLYRVNSRAERKTKMFAWHLMYFLFICFDFIPFKHLSYIEVHILIVKWGTHPYNLAVNHCNNEFELSGRRKYYSRAPVLTLR